MQKRYYKGFSSPSPALWIYHLNNSSSMSGVDESYGFDGHHRHHDNERLAGVLWSNNICGHKYSAHLWWFLLMLPILWCSVHDIPTGSHNLDIDTCNHLLECHVLSRASFYACALHWRWVRESILYCCSVVSPCMCLHLYKGKNPFMDMRNVCVTYVVCNYVTFRTFNVLKVLAAVQQGRLI